MVQKGYSKVVDKVGYGVYIFGEILILFLFAEFYQCLIKYREKAVF